MSEDCTTCRHHQPALDPEGCFVQAGSTGFWGKVVVAIGGCERYEPENEREYWSDKILGIR